MTQSDAISLTWRNGTSTMVLAGDVDYSTGDISDQQLESLRTDGLLIVDMSDVTFLDSVGVSLLLRLLPYCSAVRLEHVPERIRSVLSITGVDRLFLFDDA